MNSTSIKKYIAECIGTFVLVFFGCGTAMLVGPGTSAGAYLLTALAFGLSIVAMAYSVGNISGCHVNPAVSLAVFITGGMSLKDFIGYVIAQFAGALTASGFLAMIWGMGGISDATSTLVFDNTKIAWGFGANTMDGVGGNHFAGFLVEIILTAVFVFVILGVPSKKAKHGSFGGLVIGLSLTLIHILGIGLTGTSVNPARSFGPAFCAMFGGNFKPLACLWAFILGPAIGAAAAAIGYKFLENNEMPRLDIRK